MKNYIKNKELYDAFEAKYLAILKSIKFPAKMEMHFILSEMGLLKEEVEKTRAEFYHSEWHSYLGWLRENGYSEHSFFLR